MLMIRLQRVGRKNDPSFRVVVTDSRNSPKSGRFVEIVGSYDARKDRAELKKERILDWISKGANPSSTIHNLLIEKGVIEGKKIDVSSKPITTTASSTASTEGEQK
ncbi:30S ribosomal protein S16 [Candidatus Giovannonibacteria bacterium]|nr:30S ribosomal protein S16 [Candidatus Giovannonibacteria bacterium]